MPARSIKSCAITFGMISIPVKVFTMTADEDAKFHQAHANCGSRIKYKKFCAMEDCEVLAEQIERVFEYAKGTDIVVPDSVIAGLPIPSKLTLDLQGFVDGESIDPVYLEKAYWLEPEKVGLKPYQMLRLGMVDKAVWAVGKICLRNKEAVCILRPAYGAILMHTLFWPGEVRTDQVPTLPEPAINEMEMGMVHQLIDGTTVSQFIPEQFINVYQIKLMEAIEALKDGTPLEEVKAHMPEPTQEPDIMALLKQSLANLKKPE